MRFVFAVLLLLSLVWGTAANQPVGLVIMVNGWTGDGFHNPYHEPFTRLGYATCQVNLPSDGTPDEFVSYVRERVDACLGRFPTRRSEVTLTGMSLGSYAAARLADQYSAKVGTVVLQFAANYPDEWRGRKLSTVIGIPEPHAKLVAWRGIPLQCGAGEQNAAVASLCAFRRAGGTTYVVQGTGDPLVPMQTAQNYASAARAELLTLPQGHGPGSDDEMALLVARVVGLIEPTTALPTVVAAVQ